MVCGHAKTKHSFSNYVGIYKHVGISRIINFEMILKAKPGTR